MPDGQISSVLRKTCQDPESKIFRFSRRPNQDYIHTHPVPTRGALAIVTTWDGDAVDAEAATDERGGRVRQRRVVLTSRCWRQALKKLTLPRGDGGKRAVLRGELVISRKAIAQGMSDVLRCPVCSCAHFLCTLRMRPRVQRASGIPCALYFREGVRYLPGSGATRREIAKAYLPFSVIPGRAKHEPGIHRTAELGSNGFRACAEWRIYDARLRIGE